MDNKYAFISYQTSDTDDACWVKKVLIENGINCWMAPDSIPGGSSYADEIDDAINNCTVFVLVLSEKAQQSKWVKKELDRAINTGKLVLPFMIENIQLEKAFNFYLTDVQRYAAYESKLSEVEKMVKHIQAVMGVSVGEAFNAPGETVVSPQQEKAEEPKKETEQKKNTDTSFDSLYEDAKGAFEKMKSNPFMEFIYKFTPYNKEDAANGKIRYALNISTIGWAVASVLHILGALFSNILSFALVVVASFLCWNGLLLLCKKVAQIEDNFKVLALVICGLASFIGTNIVLMIVSAIF